MLAGDVVARETFFGRINFFAPRHSLGNRCGANEGANRLALTVGVYSACVPVLHWCAKFLHLSLLARLGEIIAFPLRSSPGLVTSV